MGQIFNRIKNIFKANAYTYAYSNDFSIDDDDELKRIIDELSNDPKNNNQSDYQQNNIKDPKLLVSLNVLGFNELVDYETIKKTYKKKIAEFHPDRYINDHKKHEEYLVKAKEINAAYSYLKKYYGK